MSTGHLAVIPARGGSKRLPRKNIALLGGAPMIVHTIEAARRSAVFDAVVVATDDPEISRIASDAAAEVPDALPADLAGDLVSSTDAALWALDRYEERGGRALYLHVLQPSSPLRSAEDIIAARELLEAGREHVIGVTPIDPHYFHWALRQESDSFRMWFRQDFLIERPLLPQVFRPNGAIKASAVASLRTDRHIMRSDRLAGHVMPEERAVHVATEFDLLLAEALLARRR